MQSSHKWAALVVLVLVIAAIVYWRRQRKSEEFLGVSFNRDYNSHVVSSGDRA